MCNGGVTNVVLGLVAFGAAFLCWGFAIYENWTLARLRRTGVYTQGTVIRLVEATKGESLKVPVIAFTDDRGERIEFRPRVAAVGLQYPVGRVLPLLYPPGKPRQARVVTKRSRMIPTFFTVVGGFVLAGAGVLLLATT